MSLIRRNDEHWKSNLVGLTFTKKLESAMLQRHSLEVGIERAETHLKEMRLQLQRVNGVTPQKLRVLQSINECSAVTVTNPDGKIVDVGFNCADDLILDNFGKWLAGIAAAPTSVGDGAGYTTVTLNDTGNTARTVAIYREPSADAYSTFSAPVVTGVMGSYIQLGDSDTAATRADFNIGSALPDAPESSMFGTSTGSYGSGAISFSGAVTAGGASTAKEMGWFCKWKYGVTIGTFMLFHDLLVPTVAYVAGQTLNASYSITL